VFFHYRSRAFELRAVPNVVRLLDLIVARERPGVGYLRILDILSFSDLQRRVKMRKGTLFSVALLLAAMPLVAMAGVKTVKNHNFIRPPEGLIDHTGDPYISSADLQFTAIPVPDAAPAGRHPGANPEALTVGWVFDNVLYGSNYSAGTLGYGDDYDTINDAPVDILRFNFVGGVNTAGDVVFFDFYGQDGSGGPDFGTYYGFIGVQLPYGGNYAWTLITQVLDPSYTPTLVPDAGWIFGSGGALIGDGSGDWFLTDTAPGIGTEDPAQGGCPGCGAMGEDLRAQFEFDNNFEAPAPNDDCQDATIAVIGATTTGSNAQAESDDQGCLFDLNRLYYGPASPFTNQVWYKITGNGETITADTCDETGTLVQDAALELVCNSCDYPVCLDVNDDAGCGAIGYEASISWCSAPGQTYYIAVTSAYDYGIHNLTVTSDGMACSNPTSCAYCGDGVLAGDEECDDGNNDNLDGCNAGCMLECGDGFRGPVEECDDGNTADGDGCSSTCEFEGSIPTISEWGMLVLGSLLLIGLTVKFRRRTATA
jgi:cysteine-rich repeat protein